MVLESNLVFERNSKLRFLLHFKFPALPPILCGGQEESFQSVCPSVRLSVRTETFSFAQVHIQGENFTANPDIMHQ